MILPGCYSAGYERRTHIVCGRRLHPLTLGHAKVLYLAESPYVVPACDTITAQDTLLAVAICTRAVAPGRDELKSLAYEGTRMDTPDLATAAKEFRDYLAYWTDGHPRFTDEKHPPRIPWPWLYAAVMMNEFHRTEGQAWATVCADAFWKIASLAVWNGNKTYQTLDEIQTIAAMGSNDGG